MINKSDKFTLWAIAVFLFFVATNGCGIKHISDCLGPKSFLPANLIGTWQSKRTTPDCRNFAGKSLPPIMLKITIHANKTVSGCIGQAKLTNARLVSSSNWIKILLGFNTVYAVKGTLLGKIAPTDPATRKTIVIPLKPAGSALLINPVCSQRWSLAHVLFRQSISLHKTTS